VREAADLLLETPRDVARALSGIAAAVERDDQEGPAGRATR
jgi:hypothetical protein